MESYDIRANVFVGPVHPSCNFVCNPDAAVLNGLTAAVGNHVANQVDRGNEIPEIVQADAVGVCSGRRPKECGMFIACVIRSYDAAKAPEEPLDPTI